MKEARLQAISTWVGVEMYASAAVAEARKQAVEITRHSLLVGTQSAILRKQHRQKHRQQKKNNMSPKLGMGSRAAALWAKLRKRVIPVHFKFHDVAWRRRTIFTDGYLNPATDMDHPYHKAKGKISMADVAQQVQERKKRAKMEEIMRLHKQREEEMYKERILRLQMIEEQKRKKKELEEKKQREYLLERANKEKKKKEFLQRVEVEQISGRR